MPSVYIPEAHGFIRNCFHFLNIVGAARQLRGKSESATLVRFISSQHVRDLKFISEAVVWFVSVFTALMAVVSFLKIASDSHGGFHWKTVLDLNLPLVGGVIAAGAVVIGWAYRTAGNRLGVVDLFASEVMTLCRIGTVLDVARQNLVRYEMLNSSKTSEARGIPSVVGLNRFVSGEEYFQIFSSSSRELEVLEANVVNEVTSFYTYMKIIRDLSRQHAAIAGATQDDIDISKKVQFKLIYMLFLSYEAARKSIRSLVEYEPAHVENVISILLTELMVFNFLRTHLEEMPAEAGSDGTGFRSQRMKLREPEYQREIDVLYGKIEMHFSEDESNINGEYSKDWRKAAALWPELSARLDGSNINIYPLSERTQEALRQ